MSEDNQFKRQAAEAKRKKLEEAAEREREKQAAKQAKVAAKKKANQAVEDEWFFDGSKEETPVNDSDDDNDLGFQMLSGTDLNSAQTGARESGALRVTNLIDFQECDVQGEASPALQYDDAGDAGHGAAQGGAAPGHADPLESLQDEDLSVQVAHLKQLLSDAQAEKTIQVDIIRDELADKQRMVSELTRERDERDERLRRAEERLQVFEGKRGENGHAAPPAASAAPPAAPDVALLLEETRRMLEEARSSLSGQPPAPAGSDEADPRSLRDAAAALRDAAEKHNQERARLTSRLGVVQRVAGETAAASVEKAERDEAFVDDAQIVEVLGRQAAQALKELRLNTERQLAWISKRMQTAS